MDVQGALGLSDEYRNGFDRIRVSFRVAGDAPEEKLREVVERAQQRSAVFDMVTNGVPVRWTWRLPRRATAVGGCASRSHRPRPPDEEAAMTPAPIAATNAAVAAAEFADAMSTLASGVVLVTCRLADRPWGMTVTAFASVSAYPPTVLVSLGSGTAALARSRRQARSG